MSGIYIPGVENLKCNDCFWAIGYRLKCSCSSEQANYDTGTRPSDCPLIPVPDHGRLVILPCKVGDTVYEVVKKRVDLTGYRMEWGWETAVEAVKFRISMTDSVGKTVFLTREEAESVKERYDVQRTD